MHCSTVSVGNDENRTLKPKLEVADIFQQYSDNYRCNHSVSYEQKKAINAILQCRTVALGGHVDQCDHCGATDISYNSCRNRHCPKCQTVKKLRWIKQREAELLPVPYFHVVFTLPHELNMLVCSNSALLYDLLFKATTETLLAFGQDPKRLGGELGAILVLHTWGQNLSLHPHLHCIVPGGALTKESAWVEAKSNYLFPTKAMAKHFRANYLQRLQTCYAKNELQFHGESKRYASPTEFNKLKEILWQKNWVVYAKKPFAGPQQIIQYLSQYTHRIAISNHRLLSCENGKVSFQWRDYSDQNKTKVMTLKAEEFIRRYLQHVLPSGFTRIRQIGFLANRFKATKLKQCRMALNFNAAPIIEETTDELLLRVYKVNIHRCQYCHIGNKKTILMLHNKYHQHRGHDTS
jgi:hypothetical protein